MNYAVLVLRRAADVTCETAPTYLSAKRRSPSPLRRSTSPFRPATQFAEPRPENQIMELLVEKLHRTTGQKFLQRVREIGV